MTTEPVTALPVSVAPTPNDPFGIMSVLRFAVSSNVSADTIERLVALQERAQDRQAASEFYAAMGAFQSECPPIEKNRLKQIVSKKGANHSYSYRYAELDQIARVTRPLLTKNGLSYTWDSATKDGMIFVTCKVGHVGGHSSVATFASPTKALTDSMSAQQEVAAALTFGRRQSLIQALGLTTCDPDRDGADAEVEKISEAQVKEIEERIVRTKSNRESFLVHFDIGDVSDLLVRDFNRARIMLLAKEAK